MALKSSIQLIGDRVLIKAQDMNKSKGGIILPTATEKTETLMGVVVRVGPGFLSSYQQENVDEWVKHSSGEIKYTPLDIKENDFVMFFQKAAQEILIDGEKYFVAPQAAILIYDRNYFNSIV